ncbi:hypothetical protein IDM40_02580 [Nocardiopsis sp. HNM0947]|uniref:Uncharacterized protein n=1 Tax=Nocardiopsis coralli TaxID=2772213 RepID=A0ABR9P166_9ACTN|nr:hypothetical protein [Nocardiopsis coralli]MBE2997594.1 hypothetical protein [Nocardiopsis coralli]
MIPGHWRAHHRDEDGEVLGYLRPEGEGHVPVTPFGHALEGPQSEDEARAALDSRGLTYLADPWLLTLPGREEPVQVRILEVSPRRMRVANADYGYDEVDIGHVFEVDVPAEGMRPA